MNCTDAGKLGGLARAKNLSKKRRMEISRLANKIKNQKHGKAILQGNRNKKIPPSHPPSRDDRKDSL